MGMFLNLRIFLNLFGVIWVKHWIVFATELCLHVQLLDFRTYYFLWILWAQDVLGSAYFSDHCFLTNITDVHIMLWFSQPRKLLLMTSCVACILFIMILSTVNWDGNIGHLPPFFHFCFNDDQLRLPTKGSNETSPTFLSCFCSLPHETF